MSMSHKNFMKLYTQYKLNILFLHVKIFFQRYIFVGKQNSTRVIPSSDLGIVWLLYITRYNPEGI